MEKALTLKQEKFAQVYVETGNASEAYRTAYDVKQDITPGTVWSRACENLKKPCVAARVAELQLQAAEAHAVTIASLTAELDEARAMAIRMEQSTAMTAATMGKAKLHGKLVDKVAGPDGGAIPMSLSVTVQIVD